MRTKGPKGPVNAGQSQQGGKAETSQNQPKPTKQPQSRIPPPQAARIRSRYIAGDSIRKISRSEGRDRETITRIVRSNEVQLYIRDLRAEYIRLGREAIKAMRKVLSKGKDGRIALQLLTDIGVVPSPVERYRLLSGNSETGNLVLDGLKLAQQMLTKDEPDDEPDAPSK